MATIASAPVWRYRLALCPSVQAFATSHCCGLTRRSTGRAGSCLRLRWVSVAARRLPWYVRPQNPMGRRIQSQRFAGAFRLGLAVSAFASNSVNAHAIAPGARRLSWSECAPGRNSRFAAGRCRARCSAVRSLHIRARRCEVRRQRSCSILHFGAAFADARYSPSRSGCLLRSASACGPHLRPNPAVERTRRFMTSTWRASARRAAHLVR